MARKEKLLTGTAEEQVAECMHIAAMYPDGHGQKRKIMEQVEEIERAENERITQPQQRRT